MDVQLKTGKLKLMSFTGSSLSFPRRVELKGSSTNTGSTDTKQDHHSEGVCNTFLR